MRTLLGEWSFAHLMCRIFGHSWRAEWARPRTLEYGCVWIAFCRRCNADQCGPRLQVPMPPGAALPKGSTVRAVDGCC